MKALRLFSDVARYKHYNVHFAMPWMMQTFSSATSFLSSSNSYLIMNHLVRGLMNSTSSGLENGDNAEIIKNSYDKLKKDTSICDGMYRPFHKIDGSKKEWMDQLYQDVSNMEKTPHGERIFQSWWKNYKELVSFYEKHGHCDVPLTACTNIDLVQFIKTHRRVAKNKTGPYYTNQKHIWKLHALRAIGFKFDPLEETWKERFLELQQYKKEHGNCFIPQHYDANPQLAKWAHEQRVQYRLLLASSPSSHMTWERVDALESIGFIWEVHEYLFQQHFEDFRRFRRTYGHALVPQQNGKLGRWVNNIRHEYKKLLQKKSSSILSHERFLLLQEEGFIWDVHEYKWQEKCAAVCAFRNLLGRWPTKKDDRSLASWIKTQRDLYLELLESQQKQNSSTRKKMSSKLTPQRVEILKQIGLLSSMAVCHKVND